MATTARQTRLYTDRCTAWTRSRTRSTDSIGTPGAETFSLAGMGIAYYHQSTVNLPDETEAGQMITPEALTAEHGHFYVDETRVQIGGIIKNTTIGSRLSGKFFSVLSDPKITPSRGARHANKQSFSLREISTNDLPAGVS